MVDDDTEGMANMATWSTQRTQTDNIDTMVFMLMKFVMLLIPITIFQADVKSAFHRLPMRPDHFVFSVIVYMYKGGFMTSTHKSSNFWAISSVWAWHRESNVALAVCRQIFMIDGHGQICG